MRVFLPLLACVLLTACAPVYVTAPAGGDVLPVEAGHIVAMATATAAAQATQIALATATDQAARATGAAVATGTMGALVVQQTEAAIQLTQAAGEAEATDNASIKTQAARASQAAATPSAAAMLAAVRATATALARQDQQAAADQARGQEIASARAWLLLIVGILILLGLGLALVFGVSDILSARAHLMHAAAARAATEARQMRIMQYGGVLLQLRGAGGWEIMSAPQLAGPVIENMASVPSPVREVPVREKEQVVGTLEIGLAETPERQRVLRLLDAAISIVGAHAGFVPSAERLGLHPQDWQQAVDHLKAGPDRPAFVMTSVGRPAAGQKGRTRLCQPGYMTLGALRDGVKRGDVLPRPEPAPASPEPGNIHNVISE